MALPDHIQAISAGSGEGFSGRCNQAGSQQGHSRIMNLFDGMTDRNPMNSGACKTPKTGTIMRCLTRFVLVLSLAVPATIAVNTIVGESAHADLRVCNKSGSRVGISIGYRSERGWTTEGWWNLEASACEIILPGDLKSQYYYMFAVDYDQGGEWAGNAFMCTADQVYTIHGIEDCLARGFQRTGFLEIDTGTQTSWTVQLTEPTQTGTGGK